MEPQKRNKRKKDWGDHGEYMNDKLRKLDHQFTEDIQSAATEREEATTIFQGLAIFINGFTFPPADELRKLFVLHGGRFQQYFSRSSVTHIIATNLPDSKITEIRDKKILRPQWILDSIKERQCLPIEQYLLFSGRQALQKQLNFSKTDHDTCSIVQNASTEENKSNFQNNDSELNIQSLHASNTTKEFKNILPSNVENENFDWDSKAASDFPDPSIITDLSMSVNQTETSTCIPLKNTEVPRTDKEINSRHLKAGEANFMNEFYNNSRLHHLSTWSAEFKQFTCDLIKSRVKKGVVPYRYPGPGRYGRVIMHVDMDCFFVSVGLRNRPDLLGKPVAVCHGGKHSASKGTSPGKQMTSSSFFTSMSEIASCSYEARKAGVHNGMFLGIARRLCPAIVCIPYSFQDYREVSKTLFEILVEYSHDVEAVSCDEAFLDVTNSLDDQTTPLALARAMRKEIRKKTDCDASIGIGTNVLIARMCTRLAKPDGEFYLSTDDDVLEFIGRQKVTDLPGIGRAQGQKLKSLGINSCADLQKCSLQLLQQSFGEKTGLTLYRYCRGEDDRPIRVERERKSVSAEINYGMRFTKESEAEHFIDELSREVQKRLKDCGVKGHSITFKMKVRRQGAQEPLKFMGHGICDNIARSAAFQVPTDDSRLIFKKCLSLFRQLRVPCSDVRGLGIQVSKLTHGAASRTLHDFAQSTSSVDINNTSEVQSSAKEDVTKTVNKSELNHVEYGGISEIINSPSSGSPINSPSSGSPPNSFYCAKDLNEVSLKTTGVELSATYLESLGMDSQALPPLPRFTPDSSAPKRAREIPSAEEFDDDLCLPSLSQLDVSTLNALPEDIRLKIERHYNKVEVKKAIEPCRPIEDHQLLQKTEPPATSLGGQVSFDGVQSVIKEWTNTEAPIKEDVEVVSGYLVNLIPSKNMERLYHLIRFLTRCIKKNRNDEWQVAGQDIVERVQLTFIEHYGAPMVF